MTCSAATPAGTWNRKKEEIIVKRPEDGDPSDAWAEDGALISFLAKTAAVVDVELRKLRHDSTELLTRAFQPVLWLVVFGEVFERFRAVPSGGLSYRAFLAPGILAQSVLFVSIFYGIAVIWERDLGIVQKLLVTPTPREALVLGKGKVVIERVTRGFSFIRSTIKSTWEGRP